MIACLAGPLAQWQPLGGPITVRLIPKARDDLLRLQRKDQPVQDRCREPSHHAVRVHRRAAAAGQELLLRDKETRRTHLVRFDEPGSVPPLPGWGGASQFAATSRTSY